MIDVIDEAINEILSTLLQTIQLIERHRMKIIIKISWKNFLIKFFIGRFYLVELTLMVSIGQENVIIGA